MKVLISLVVGIAIGVWIGDTNPAVADSIRNVTNQTIEAAEEFANQ